jgi:hypothetical protein
MRALEDEHPYGARGGTKMHRRSIRSLLLLALRSEGLWRFAFAIRVSRFAIRVSHSQCAFRIRNSRFAFRDSRFAISVSRSQFAFRNSCFAFAIHNSRFVFAFRIRDSLHDYFFKKSPKNDPK